MGDGLPDCVFVLIRQGRETTPPLEIPSESQHFSKRPRQSEPARPIPESTARSTNRHQDREQRQPHSSKAITNASMYRSTRAHTAASMDAHRRPLVPPTLARSAQQFHSWPWFVPPSKSTRWSLLRGSKFSCCSRCRLFCSVPTNRPAMHSSNGVQVSSRVAWCLSLDVLHRVNVTFAMGITQECAPPQKLEWARRVRNCRLSGSVIQGDMCIVSLVLAIIDWTRSSFTPNESCPPSQHLSCI